MVLADGEFCHCGNQGKQGCCGKGPENAFDVVGWRGRPIKGGDLLEGIVLHSFEGKSPFGAESVAFIEQMRAAYGLDLTAADSHQLTKD